MSEKHDDGGLVFPSLSEHGKTLLDEFAGLAMQGYIADGATPDSRVPALSYGIAAGMIAEKRRREAEGKQ